MNDYAINGEYLLWPDDLRRGIWPRSFAIWVLIGWIALLIIRPWEALRPELAEIHLERIFAILAILVVAISGKVRVIGSYQTTGLLLWLFALGISSICGINLSASWEVLYTYITTFIFYIALLSVLRTPYQLLFIVAAFVAVMTVYLGKSQWEYFIHGGQSFSMGVYRLQGIDMTYAHPNAVACSAAITLPFAYFFWKIRREFTAAWPELWKKAFPIFILGCFFIAVSSIFLTNSRSGIFAFVLFMFLAALHGKSVGTMIFRVLAGVIVLAAIWMIIPEATKGRIANTWDSTSGPEAESAYVSGEGRVRGVQMGMKMFETHPLTGVGLGNFIPYRRAYLDGVNLVAHNTVGGVLGETGLIGGLAFLVFFSGIFVNCHAANRMARQIEVPDSDMLARLSVACRDSLILLLFCGMFGDVQARAHLYWIAAYCLLARTFIESIARNSQDVYEMELNRAK